MPRREGLQTKDAANPGRLPKERDDTANSNLMQGLFNSDGTVTQEDRSVHVLHHPVLEWHLTAACFRHTIW